MKRRLSFAICLLCFVLLFGSCAKAGSDGGDDGKYVAFTAYFNVSNADHLAEEVSAKDVDKGIISAHCWQKATAESFRADAQQQISVSILGNDYSANLAEISVSDFNSPYYLYKTAAGDKIEVDCTGRVTYFESALSFSHFQRTVTKNDEALSPEESLARAQEYLTQLFGTEALARYSAELPDTSGTVVWCFFKPVAREIGTYKNTDRITIVLTEKGTLLKYYAYNLGAFDKVELPADFTDAKVRQIIGASLNNQTCNIELDSNKQLVIFDRNRVACSVAFRVVNGDNVSKWVSVVIPLE